MYSQALYLWSAIVKKCLDHWCRRHKETKVRKRTWKYFLINEVDWISSTNYIVNKKRLKMKSQMCLSWCGRNLQAPGSLPLNNTPFQFIQSILIFIMFRGEKNQPVHLCSHSNFCPKACNTRHSSKYAWNSRRTNVDLAWWEHFFFEAPIPQGFSQPPKPDRIQNGSDKEEMYLTQE